MMGAINCKICGKEFVPVHGGIIICSDDCRLINRRINAKRRREEEKKNHMPAMFVKNCRQCGKEFQTRNYQKVTCSEECSIANRNMLSLQYHRGKKAEKKVLTESTRSRAKLKPLNIKNMQAQEEGMSYGKYELKSYLEQQSIEMAKRRREMELEWERKKKA